jgi:hypothetical protein
MRIYIPATSALLEQLILDGKIDVAEAYAVTDALREWYDGDDEELEYIATAAAARASLSLLSADPSALRRRVVLAAEHDAVQPVDAGHRAEVSIAGSVNIAVVHAALVDESGAEGDVEAAAALIDRATVNEDARFAVDQAQSHELLWFAAQELPFIF